MSWLVYFYKLRNA